MEKNYYELLEIDKNASTEIIEKAYKTLVKKYHPDLQDEKLKYEYEEKLKIINEAYEILSDENKRNQYDLSLSKKTISQEDYNNLYYENTNLKNELNNLKNSQNSYKENINISNNSPINNTSSQNEVFQKQVQKNQEEYNLRMQNAINKAYQDAYIKDLKRRGFKIKYKKTKKDYLALFLSFLIIIIVFFILWQIPPIKNYFIDIYNENPVIHYIVNIFISVFHK